jgi:8-oxo-dGTP pyrophosphatase MutT (NUDIX family)
VETILETCDGNFVVLRRSAGVATFRGVFNGPSGHPEPKDVGLVDAASTSSAADLTCIETSAVRRELFDSVRKECVEETGIPADKMSAPRLIGAMTDAFGKPDLLFHTRVDLTADEVGRRLANASEAWESSGADVVDAVPPDDVERVGVGAAKKPGEKEPFRCIKLGDPAPFELGSSVVLFPPDGGEGPPASGASAMTRAFWGRDPRVMSPVTRAAADCVYMLAATREGGGEPARDCVMNNALDAAMDHELHDVSRVIERRMLANAGFM